MFIHLINNYKKELDKIDKRLEISLEKEEIQGLGLKLRFIFNEIRHYLINFRELSLKIVELQQKYGFLPENVIRTTMDDIEAKIVEGIEDRSREEKEHKNEETERENDVEQAVSNEQQATALGFSTQRQEKTETQKHKENSELRVANENSTEQQNTISEKQQGDEIIDSISEKSESQPIICGTRIQDAILDEFSFEKVDSKNTDKKSASIEDFLKLTATLPSITQDTSIETIIFSLNAFLSAYNELSLQNLLDEILSMLDTPSIITTWETDKNTFLFSAGFLAKQLGKIGYAINFLDECAKGNNSIAEVYLLLANCCYQKCLYEKALINYRLAVQLNDTFVKAHLGIAECLLQINKPDEAIEYLDTLNICEKEEKHKAILLRTQSLIAIDNLEKAYKEIKYFLDEGAKSSALYGQGYFLLAQIEEKKGNITETIEAYDKALEYIPDSPEINYHLAHLYFEHQAIPLAKKHLNAIVKKFPEGQWTDKAREILYSASLL